MGLCDKAEEALALAEQGNIKEPAEIPVVYQQVKKAVEVDLKGADLENKRLEIASELFDHMCTSISASGTSTELSRLQPQHAKFSALSWAMRCFTSHRIRTHKSVSAASFDQAVYQSRLMIASSIRISHLPPPSTASHISLPF